MCRVLSTGTKAGDNTHMLILWKQLSESVSRPPLQTHSSFTPIASPASWVLSNPVDCAKRRPSLLSCTVWLHHLVFHLGKNISSFLPHPWEATVWHASNAPTHNPSQSTLSLLRCPQVPINTHLSGLSFPSMPLHGRTGPSSDCSVWCG